MILDIDKLIMAKVNINIEKYSILDWTILQLEVQEVHLKEVEKLLQVKIVINAKVNYCFSPKALHKNS